MSTENASQLDLASPVDNASYARKGIGAFINKERRSLSSLVVFIVLMLVFVVANPQVFLNPLAYRAVFTALPISIIMAVPLVFVVTSGEIDLSFGSVMGLAGYAFAVFVVDAGNSPWLGLLLALAVGGGAGLLNGIIVTRIGLSSLVATLGMSFLLRGIVYMFTEGMNISLVGQKGTLFYNALVGNLGFLPVQMIWAIVFGVFSAFVFNYHKFGAHVHCVGDNENSAREMGINVQKTRTLTFVYVGIAAGFAGVTASLLNNTYYPTSGEGLLLPVLAAVFVGGTPTWGGVGTVVGAIIGAFIIGFIETGVIAAGLTGYYTRFFYGLIIILALIGHKFNQPRYR
ncbi:MAG: ABC transporter permease [Anaerolineaceae bacterium]|nr:ABC transporter permease [Anaerolineaceae bacterium]